MSMEITNAIAEAVPRFEGFVYPNESGTHPLWGFLIVLYPYITGLVAGAFIMASLVRVFPRLLRLLQFSLDGLTQRSRRNSFSSEHPWKKIEMRSCSRRGFSTTASGSNYCRRSTG